MYASNKREFSKKLFNLKPNIMKKILTTLLVLIMFGGAAIAQTGSIKGIVKDKKTGEPLFNVAIFVKMAGAKVGDAADFDGKYTIKPLKPGTYTVYAQITGYGPIETQNVIITSDKITYVNLEMERTSEELPTWTVVEHEISIDL